MLNIIITPFVPADFRSVQSIHCFRYKINNNSQHQHQQWQTDDYFPCNVWSAENVLNWRNFFDCGSTGILVREWTGRNIPPKELANRFPALLHIVYQQLIWWNNRLHLLIVFSIFLLQQEFWLVNTDVGNTMDKLHRTQPGLPCFTVAWWKGKQQHTKWLSSNTQQHFHLFDPACKPNVLAVSLTQDYLGVGKSFEDFFIKKCLLAHQ